MLTRFARRHLWGVCAAVSVGSQCVVARFARRHLWGICAAVSVGSQRVVARFARRHLTRICAAVSVGSQCVMARFARRHLKDICAAIRVGVAVRGGSRVLALILLVFVHHYNRARRLVTAYSPSNLPEPPLLLLYNTPGHTPVLPLGAWYSCRSSQSVA